MKNFIIIYIRYLCILHFNHFYSFVNQIYQHINMLILFYCVLGSNFSIISLDIFYAAQSGLYQVF